jgi:hypothetical protein
MYMLHKNYDTSDLFDSTRETYEKIFSGMERKVYDSNSIKNRITIANLLLLEAQDSLEQRLKIARKLYESNFSSFSRWIDGDPIGNILALAEISHKLFVYPKG